MASFLDVSLLAGYSKFFVFILVWLAVYLILKMTKAFGQTSDGLNLVIGLIIGLFVLFSPIATAVIEIIAPWFAVLLVLIMFLTVSSKMFGMKESDIVQSGTLKGIVSIAVVLIFVIITVSTIRDQVLLPGENGTSTDLSTAKSVVFHPQVMGAIFILLIAIFTIALMAGKPR